MLQTGIQLQDNFTGVLYEVMGAVNLAISSMYDMQQAVSADIDMSSMEGARDAINQATMAVQEFNQAMDGAAAGNPVAEHPAEPAPAGWSSFEGLEVFHGTGMERFEQEAAEVNRMMERLGESQSRLTQQANETELLSPQASYDIQNVENRMQGLMEQIRQVESNPLNMGTDRANAQQERLRANMDELLWLQENLNQAMQGMDIGEINAAYLRLSQSVSNAERMVRDSFSHAPPVEPVEIPVHWQGEPLDVFVGSGADRFRQEIASANRMVEQLSNTQNDIARQAYNTNIFPPQAFQDLNHMATRINWLRERVQQIGNNPVNFGTDQANAGLEQMRGLLDQLTQQQESLNRAMDDMDVSAANAAYLRLSQTVGNTERYIRDNVNEQGRFNQEISQGTSQANSLVRMIKGAVAAYATMHTLAAAVSLSDQMTSTTARLNMMNDGRQGIEELQDMIFQSAERSRGAYQATADAVSKLGLMAGDAFSSSGEIIAFMEQVNKQFTIAGTEAAGIEAAMLQLTQAMGSGILRGEEYNSVLEQAPNIIQAIADYMEVTKGQLKDMAAEGAITAEIVKAAMFDVAEETDAKFESMPMTFEQIGTSLQNTAMVALQPLLDNLNDIANSQAFQEIVNNAAGALTMLVGIANPILEQLANSQALWGFANGMIQAFSLVAVIALQVVGLLVAGAIMIVENWSWISPIIYGVAIALGIYTAAVVANSIAQGINTMQKRIAAIQAVAHGATITAEMTATTGLTAAQLSFNASLYACPLTWIILLIIALIAVIFAVCNAIAKMTGIANTGFGVMTGGINVVIAFVKNLGLFVANIALGIWNALGALCHNMVTAFQNAISSVQSWFYSLLSTALTVIGGICAELNKLPFVEFDYSGITSAAEDYAAKAAEAAENKGEYQDIGAAFDEGMSTYETFQEGWASQAFEEGAEWGDGVAEKISSLLEGLTDGFGNDPGQDDNGAGLENEIASGLDNSAAAGNLNDIAGNTGAIKDSLDVTEEDLKYLRDIAEQETVNRFTTASITIDQSGMKNTVNGTNDLDGFVSGLTDAVDEAARIITEGVH